MATTVSKSKIRLGGGVPPKKRAYSVYVFHAGVIVSTKIVSATDGYHACSLAEEYMTSNAVYSYQARRIDSDIHYDTVVDEYAAVVDGEIVGWFTSRRVAENAYYESLRVRREHARNNEPIPFNGSATEYDTDDNVSESELGLREVM